jgi:hypothetical protein
VKWAAEINGIFAKLDLRDRAAALNRAQHWAPGKDSLSEVLDDANKVHKQDAKQELKPQPANVQGRPPI